ncbi:MAG: DUF481 domain-containing protein [Sedimentisphaerales bacterium]|nr:DUF481 domain-containing protein [Sedimentisphaerales bacterium]
MKHSIYNMTFVMVCTLLYAAGGFVQADEVLLNNGDRLTGTVETILDGKMSFKSDLIGPVSIAMKDIRTFTTQAPAKLVLADGTILQQSVAAAQADKVTLAGSELIQAQEIALADIQALNPPEKAPPQWEGSVTMGLTSVHGNTKSESIQAGASASRRTEKDRTTLGADYGRSKQEDPDTGQDETTEDWWKTRAKYDYFFTEKLYGFLEGRYETDKIAQLDRRLIGAAGGGYQWIEQPDINFSTELGIAYLTERFKNDTGNNNETSLHAAYHFDTKLTDTIKFINDLTYYPSFGQFSDYYLTTTAEIRASLTENMFANFRTIFDYDSTPATGQGSTDIKYILGVGWNF